MAAHLKRLGGMLVRPVPTLRHMRHTGQGHMYEVFGWLLLLTAATSPVRTGRALLYLRAARFDSMFVGFLASRITIALVSVFVAGMLLAVASRGHRISYVQAVDIAAFTLTPMLLLMAIGILLGAAGFEVRVLPHRALPRGGSLRGWWIAASYGWSIALLLLALWTVRTDHGPMPSEP
ncbi:MAG: hypothetical protein AAF449_06995 [Myxococcota bacterium]